MTPVELVEKVARVIAAADGFDPDGWSVTIGDAHWKRYVTPATRAAAPDPEGK